MLTAGSGRVIRLSMRGELQGLGNFRLITLAGEGERAKVYLAQRDGSGGLDGQIALKVLRTTLTSDRAEVQAFKTRAAAAERLAPNPGIVTTHESGVCDGHPYVVLEYVEGVPLEALLPKRGASGLPASVAGSVMDGVLLALAAAQQAEQPVVHGRIEPSNILIDTDGDVRVISFGADGDAKSDFLSVTGLAQRICKEWPVEVDAWLDRLQDGEDRYAGIAETRSAFPMVTSADGKRWLARAVKRFHKRAAAKAEAAAAEDGLSELRVVARDGDGDPRTAPAVGASTSSPTRAVAAAARSALPQGSANTVPAGALSQARVVGWACLGVLLVAALIEVFRYQV